MFKLTLMIALIAFGISKYNEKYNCTDDGCPDFHDEIEMPIPDEQISPKRYCETASPFSEAISKYLRACSMFFSMPLPKKYNRPIAACAGP